MGLNVCTLCLCLLVGIHFRELEIPHSTHFDPVGLSYYTDVCMYIHCLEYNSKFCALLSHTLLAALLGSGLRGCAFDGKFEILGRCHNDVIFKEFAQILLLMPRLGTTLCRQ
jgi:hypothetical protein